MSVSSLCSFAHHPPLLSVSFSSPSSVSLSAPVVCVADKKERRRRRQGVDTMLSVWAVCPAGPGTRSKGLAVELPSSHSSSLLCLPSSPQPPHPPSRKPFYGDETAGLLGRAGLRIRIRLARVGWQMAA